MHTILIDSAVMGDVCTSGCEQCRKSQVVYLSSQLTPLLWPCLFSPSSFSLRLPLWGGKSINNSTLSCHTLHVCVRCMCMQGWFVCSIQRSQTCMQAPWLCACLQALCANTALSEHINVFACVLPSGLLFTEQRRDCRGSVSWLIPAAGGPYNPTHFCFCLQKCFTTGTSFSDLPFPNMKRSFQLPP